MEKISKGQEQKIVAALERAIKMANQGETPNAALRKVAEENSFTPPFVRRMVEAFNVSKTLAHMKHASGEARVNSFPLADAEDILKEMYPAKIASPAEKQAASFLPTSYDRPETRNFMKSSLLEVKLPPLVEKKAEPYSHDPEVIGGKRVDKLQGMRKKAENSRATYRQEVWKLRALVKEAADYFKQLYRKPFAEVERNVISEHGAMGHTLMDMVYTDGRIKEARYDSKLGIKRQLFDDKVEPYVTLNRVLKSASLVTELVKVAAKAQLDYEKLAKEWGYPILSEPEEEVKTALLDDVMSDHHIPFGENSLVPTSEVVEHPFRKKAFLPDEFATGAMSVLGLKDKPDERDMQEALSEALDPVHDAKLRAISTQTMLSDFMANDPIISSYGEGDVFKAYNQLSQLAPAVSQQPSIARGLIRRLLQSESIIEPHEAEQLTDMETQLRKGTPSIAEV
jgi:hypothetical protein